MIKEAYCSFEVSKLLNEKGFKAYTHMVYKLPSQLLHTDKECLVRNYNGITKGDCIEILAPTHQMAMAWLREVHNVFIIVEPFSNTICYFSLWQDDIYHENPLKKHFSSYEDTVEAALKYVLENLI